MTDPADTSTKDLVFRSITGHAFTDRTFWMMADRECGGYTESQLRRKWEKAGSLYWRVRWAMWDYRDARFVRQVARYMRDKEVLFVHPNGRAAPAVYIARDDVNAEPHGHVEGRMR